MALYRCGGGSASRLITKNITQNGLYNASDDNADGYSSVSVNVSGGGGSSVIKTKTEWDSLSFAEKKALGLTVIRNCAETTGDWFDYSNISLPFAIRGEFYQDSEGNITLPAMDNMIVFQGMWNNGQGNYDNLKFTSGDFLYDSKIDGSIDVFYYSGSLSRKMVTIFKETNSCNMSFRNGYTPTGYYSYGAIISIDDPNADIEILGDYYDGQVHTIITDEAYDGIICITSKGYQSARVNGEIDLEGAYLSKYDGDEKLYSDASRACIEVYSNVPTGAEITVSTPLGSAAGSAIIGVKN